MTTTYKHDDVASPEMTAKAWDDYLHRCGAGAYVSARYGSPVRDTTLSPCPDRLDPGAADRSRPLREGLAQAAWTHREADRNRGAAFRPSGRNSSQLRLPSRADRG